MRAHLDTTGLVLAGLLLAGISGAARAQSVWGGTGSTTATTNYNLSTNWSAGAPVVAGQSAVFDATGSASVSVTAGPIAPNSWTFNAASQSYAISGAAVNFSLASISGGIINNANAGQAISISNNIGESVSGVPLQQLGASTLTLSGTNTFTGGTLVSGGTLAIASGGSITSNVTVNSGGIFTNSGAVSGTVTMNSGSGQVTNNVGGTVSGLLSVVGPATNAGVLNGGARIDGGTLTNSGTIHNGLFVNSTVNFNQTAGLTDGGVNSAGVVTASGGAFGGPIHTLPFSSFTVNGTVTTDDIYDMVRGSLRVQTGSFTGITTLTTTISSGILVDAGATLGANNIMNSGTFTNSGTTTAAIVNANLGFVLTNNGTWTGTVSNSGQFINNALATVSGLVTTNGGSASTTNSGTFNGGLLNSLGSTTNSGTINGGVTVNGGTLTTTGIVTGGLTNAATVNAQGAVNGAIANNAGTFTVTGALTGNSSFTNAATATLAVSGAGAYTLQGLLSNSGVLTVAGGGQLNAFLGGITNNSGGAITIDAGGTVSGLLTNAAGTTVNNGALNGGAGVSGGTFTGTGTVTSLNVSGGTFRPGNGTPGSSMTVSGNLAFQSGALYLVQLSPFASTFAAVGGTATLNGSAGAAFLTGSYVARQYTILTAAGGVNGTFSAFDTLGIPSGFSATLSYDANNVYLNLVAGFGTRALDGNQQNVANALTNYFNSTGGIPTVFATLTPAGLSQVAGETATGSQQTTFAAMNQFMGVLTDPFVTGRGEGVTSGSGATPFAEEGDAARAYAAAGRARTTSERDAYAAIYRKAPLANIYDPRWSVWAAAYGGSQTTDGNATLGSSTTTSRIGGVAAGADYRFSPYTIAGFALAGGGTSFGVDGYGSGRSDLFQAGAFVRHSVGPAYLTAALAYGWQDITTERTVTVAGVDRLRAQFNANAFSGRFEGGYRLTPSMGIGITPYAAAQFTSFELPAYAETAVSGANTFALAYAGKTVTASRGELGLRADKSWLLETAVLTLRGRAAWVHDYNNDRSIGATFQTLPGASFVVNGAAQARDAALTSAAAELKWRNGVSLAAIFDGEFSAVTRSYAGKGIVRYSW